MRVLNFGKYLRKDGGIETHVKSLCKGLADNGIDVVNLVSSIDDKGADFKFDGYRVVETPTMGIYFSTSICPKMLLAARRLHKEKPFDLIHLHFPDPMSHLASMALPTSIPRVITWHSDIVKQKTLLKLYRPWQQMAMGSAAAIIAPTNAHFSSSQQIPDAFPQEKRHVIPFGMNYDRFGLTPEVLSQANAIRHNLKKECFVVFALGRHVEYKGFSVLLHAIALTDAHLILGGDGPLSEGLKAKVQTLGIADRVSFTGRLTDAETVACYYACDVFCLPSITTNEAFGLVQLEAMACEKPVICTQLNNGVNVVNPHMLTGITVPPNNSIELADAINRLAQNPSLRTRLGKSAKIHVLEKYSQEAMSLSHINLYKSICAKAV